MSIFIQQGTVADYDTCQGCNRQEELIEKGAKRKDLPVFWVYPEKEGAVRLCRVCLKELKKDLNYYIYNTGEIII
jgi:hypothetical protein